MLIDWLIEDILQAPSTMSSDLRACPVYEYTTYCQINIYTPKDYLSFYTAMIR